MESQRDYLVCKSNKHTYSIKTIHNLRYTRFSLARSLQFISIDGQTLIVWEYYHYGTEWCSTLRINAIIVVLTFQVLYSLMTKRIAARSWPSSTPFTRSTRTKLYCQRPRWNTTSSTCQKMIPSMHRRRVSLLYLHILHVFNKFRIFYTHIILGEPYNHNFICISAIYVRKKWQLNWNLRRRKFSGVMKRCCIAHVCKKFHWS